MKSEVFTLNEKRNVTLTTYILPCGGEFQNIKKRPFVLVIPGGGYQMCSDREGEPIALEYLKAGYHTAVLRYSIGDNAAWPNPLKDYECAMALLKARAEEWKIYTNKIVVIGFSAGGHLAGIAATQAKFRPAAVILGYAVAQDIGKYLADAPNPIESVDADTAPCFLFHTRNDSVVPALNPVKFMEKLIAYDISFESHIYSYGPHGFSSGDFSVQGRETAITARAKNWVSDSIGWLREIFGDFDNERGMTTPVVKQHISGDWDTYMSLDCTMGCVMENPKAREALVGTLPDYFLKGAGTKEAQSMLDNVRKMTLRNVLNFIHVSKTECEKLEVILQQIPNL